MLLLLAVALGANPVAKFETTMGTFSAELYLDRVPRTASNFIGELSPAPLPCAHCASLHLHGRPLAAHGTPAVPLLPLLAGRRRDIASAHVGCHPC